MLHLIMTAEEIIKTASVTLDRNFDGTVALWESAGDPTPAEPENPHPWVQAKVSTSSGEYFVYFRIDRRDSQREDYLGKVAREEALTLIRKGREPV
jgi:hypothetical protein